MTKHHHLGDNKDGTWIILVDSECRPTMAGTNDDVHILMVFIFVPCNVVRI